MTLETTFRALSYWQPGESVAAPLLSRHRFGAYITFEPDRGGFNNIRMAFEYVVCIAAVTGRTVVLPPPEPWYLVNWGPLEREGSKDGSSSFQMFFDLNRLREFVRVISVDEFIRREGERLAVPAKFCHAVRSTYSQVWDGELRESWRQWLRTHPLWPAWDPLKFMICHPDVDTAIGAGESGADSPFVDRRTAVELSPEFDSAELCHVKVEPQKGYRYLGQVATMIAFADADAAKQQRCLLKYGVVYRRQVFELAARVIDALGLYEYGAIHIRRNDFQYDVARTVPENTIDNIRQLLNDNELLYIATDETGSSFFEGFERIWPIRRWRDVCGDHSSAVLDPAEVPAELVGLVEQVICAGARCFIGSHLSTFSSYIVRLRGYMHAPDTSTYFHTRKYEKPISMSGTQSVLRASDYTQEHPIMWEDAY